MTSLFRPWAEESTIKNEVEGMTNFKELRSVEDPVAREDKYKSVKEHMKMRSEKYLMKKLKSQKNPEVSPCLDKPEITSMPYPVPCCPPLENCLMPFDCCFPGKATGSEFLDPALIHGFPPNLFEEYARLLTEQQRQAAERHRKQRPKKFRCPHCQVGFSNNGQLKGHIRIHTGERPYKCDAESCGKSFTRNEELTRHRRIHSGLRPFPCSECGKRFGRRDHLKKHVKTHFQQRYQLVPIIPSHYPYFYGL